MYNFIDCIVLWLINVMDDFNRITCVKGEKIL